jgi:hypothetical protein
VCEYRLRRRSDIVGLFSIHVAPHLLPLAIVLCPRLLPALRLLVPMTERS